MRRLLVPLITLAAAHAAHAHEGHGLPAGSHWHASDVLGFVGIGLIVAAFLLWRGKK